MLPQRVSAVKFACVVSLELFWKLFTNLFPNNLFTKLSIYYQTERCLVEGAELPVKIGITQEEEGNASQEGLGLFNKLE